MSPLLGRGGRGSGNRGGGYGGRPWSRIEDSIHLSLMAVGDTMIATVSNIANTKVWEGLEDVALMGVFPPPSTPGWMRSQQTNPFTRPDPLTRSRAALVGTFAFLKKVDDIS